MTTLSIPEFKALSLKPKESQQCKAFRHIMRSHTGIVEEFKFSKTRKFKADYAIPDKMILIEFEGIISGKSRHTTITGYTGDCNKYNLAAILGYRVLRYTALNFKDSWRDLETILNETAQSATPHSGEGSTNNTAP